MEANSTETDHTRSSNWISLSCRQRIPDRLVYSRIRRPPHLSLKPGFPDFWSHPGTAQRGGSTAQDLPF